MGFEEKWKWYFLAGFVKWLCTGKILPYVLDDLRRCELWVSGDDVVGTWKVLLLGACGEIVAEKSTNGFKKCSGLTLMSSWNLGYLLLNLTIDVHEILMFRVFLSKSLDWGYIVPGNTFPVSVFGFVQNDRFCGKIRRKLVTMASLWQIAIEFVISDFDLAKIDTYIA